MPAHPRLSRGRTVSRRVAAGPDAASGFPLQPSGLASLEFTRLGPPHNPSTPPPPHPTSIPPHLHPHLNPTPPHPTPTRRWAPAAGTAMTALCGRRCRVWRGRSHRSGDGVTDVPATWRSAAALPQWRPFQGSQWRQAGPGAEVASASGLAASAAAALQHVGQTYSLQPCLLKCNEWRRRTSALPALRHHTIPDCADVALAPQGLPLLKQHFEPRVHCTRETQPRLEPCKHRFGSAAVTADSGICCGHHMFSTTFLALLASPAVVKHVTSSVQGTWGACQPSLHIIKTHRHARPLVQKRRNARRTVAEQPAGPASSQTLRQAPLDGLPASLPQLGDAVRRRMSGASSS